VVATGTARTRGLRELIEESGRAGVPVRWVARSEIDALGVVNHQGVAATVLHVAELDERALETTPLHSDALVVVLDGIQDPQNFGACARAAEAAGAALLITRTRRAAPLSSAVVRASAGALLHLPTARVPNLPRAMECLKDRGFFFVGLDQRAEVNIHEALVPQGPLGLVVGAEERGISRLVRESCELLVAIPMRGRTASLNVASALAVGLFAFALRPDRG